MEVTDTLVDELIRPGLEADGYRLCGIKVSGRHSRPLVQVFIDYEIGSVNIDDCTRITRKLLDLFDMQERFAPDYRLEVSSPGLDAPLREAWQFRKNLGRTVAIKDDERKREFHLIEFASDESLRVEVEGEIIEMAVNELAGAKIVLFPGKKTKVRQKAK